MSLIIALLMTRLKNQRWGSLKNKPKDSSSRYIFNGYYWIEAAGTRGACGIVGQASATNQSCMAIYPNEKLMTQYLYFWYVYNGEELAFKYCQGTKQLSYTAGLIKKYQYIYLAIRENKPPSPLSSPIWTQRFRHWNNALAKPATSNKAWCKNCWRVKRD